MWDIIGIKGFLIAMLVFVPAERLFALRKEQQILRKYWKLDVFYALVNALITKAGIALILIGSVIAAAWAIPPQFQAWVAALPVWLQVGLALILSDLGFYSVHRLFHKIPWLWKFHAVHHSIEELDWLAAHRVHPVDQILTKGASLVPVFSLGFSEAAIGIYAFLYYWQTLLEHSNVRISFGPLRWIIASPQFHHWHHADQREAYDKNFAGQLSILDACFGTLHLPGKEYPGRYGTYEPVPRDYIAQMRYPFARRADSAAPEIQHLD